MVDLENTVNDSVVNDLGYGSRLNSEEYTSSIIALYDQYPAMPTKKQDEMLRKATLDLTIDHRLGIEFPREKRNQLWSIQKDIDKKRFWIGAKYFVKSLLPGDSHTLHEEELIACVLEKYRTVLNKQEIKQYFDL